MQAVEDFENTKLVYINSWYRTDYSARSGPYGTFNKIEICLMEDRQCTYLQNSPENPFKTTSPNRLPHTEPCKGTWSIENFAENEYLLKLLFNEEFNIVMKIILTPQGEVFLNGKRFQISKIKNFTNHKKPNK